jgi:hypothetical protein
VGQSAWDKRRVANIRLTGKYQGRPFRLTGVAGGEDRADAQEPAPKVI